MKILQKFVVVTLLFGLLLIGCDSDDSPTSAGPEPPSVTITYPGDSSSVADTVYVALDATDDNAMLTLELFIDDTLRYSWNSPPYIYPWNTRGLADSSWHEMWAVGMDVDSLIGGSDTIDIMINYAGGLGQSVVIVANFNDGAGTISLIDRFAGDRILPNLIGIGNTPNDILWDGGRMYVINSMSHSMDAFTLSYNNSLTSRGTFDLGLAQERSPQYGVIADDGYMYISNFSWPEVTKYDLNANIPVLILPVGQSPADIEAVGDKIYVCNSGYNNGSYDPGSISIISASMNQVVGSITDIGTNPQFMALDPTGKLHVVCTGNYFDTFGEVFVIDTFADTVFTVINLGGSPGDIAITADGIAYVAAGGWDPDPGMVFRYNTATSRILNGAANPIEVNSGASKLAIAADNTVWVTCYQADRVDKIIGETRVASYVIGDGPSAIMILER